MGFRQGYSQRRVEKYTLKVSGGCVCLLHI